MHTWGSSLTLLEEVQKGFWTRFLNNLFRNQFLNSWMQNGGVSRGSGAPTSNRWIHYREHKVDSKGNGRFWRRHTESRKMYGDKYCVQHTLFSPIHLLYILLHDMDRIIAWWWTVSFRNCCVHAGYIILSPIHLIYKILHVMDIIVAWWWTVYFKNSISF